MPQLLAALSALALLHPACAGEEACQSPPEDPRDGSGPSEELDPFSPDTDACPGFTKPEVAPACDILEGVEAGFRQNGTGSVSDVAGRGWMATGEKGVAYSLFPGEPAVFDFVFALENDIEYGFVVLVDLEPTEFHALPIADYPLPTPRELMAAQPVRSYRAMIRGGGVGNGVSILIDTSEWEPCRAYDVRLLKLPPAFVPPLSPDLDAFFVSSMSSLGAHLDVFYGSTEFRAQGEPLAQGEAVAGRALSVLMSNGEGVALGPPLDRFPLFETADLPEAPDLTQELVFEEPEIELTTYVVSEAAFKYGDSGEVYMVVMQDDGILAAPRGTIVAPAREENRPWPPMATVRWRYRFPDDEAHALRVIVLSDPFVPYEIDGERQRLGYDVRFSNVLNVRHQGP